MSFTGDVNNAQDHLAKPEKLGSVEVGPDGGEFTDIKSDTPIIDWTHVFEQFQLDPSVFEILGDTVRCSTWQQSKRLENGERDVVNLYSYRAMFRRKRDDRAAIELASLITPVKPRKTPKTLGLPRVALISDGQLGKDGPDFPGPDALDQAFDDALAKIAAIVEAERPSVLVIPDLGDSIEGITSSAPNQIATNWLELDDQLRMWQRRLTKTILTLAPFAGRTIIAAVPSNHGEIRNPAGKVGYGDYGLGVAHTVEDAFTLHGTTLDLEFCYPATKYDVVTYVDVADTRLAFTHGHHAKQIERIPQWVANQAASLRSPMREARIVAHGHFHQPGYRESRGRAIISAPMFDAGSAWFENLTGEFSRPGIATFLIRDRWVSELQFIEPSSPQT